jgi:hypothetical protein
MGDGGQQLRHVAVIPIAAIRAAACIPESRQNLLFSPIRRPIALEPRRQPAVLERECGDP